MGIGMRLEPQLSQAMEIDAAVATVDIVGYAGERLSHKAGTRWRNGMLVAISPSLLHHSSSFSTGEVASVMATYRLGETVPRRRDVVATRDGLSCVEAVLGSLSGCTHVEVSSLPAELVLRESNSRWHNLVTCLGYISLRDGVCIVAEVVMPGSIVGAPEDGEELAMEQAAEGDEGLPA